MSEIKVDTLTGKTTAGDITVTSEGGAATMQLQQGLAKAWVNFNNRNTFVVRDSLNTSSVTDGGTGNSTPNFLNSFRTAYYVPVCSPVFEYSQGRGVSGLGVGINGDESLTNMATNQIRLNHSYGSSAGSNGGAKDGEGNFATFTGDLA